MVMSGDRSGCDTAAERRASVRVVRCVSSVALLAVACGVSDGRRAGARPDPPEPSSPATSPFRDFSIVNEYPHDPKAYTQGLFFADGFLYEGTGRHGESSLRRVDLATGRVEREVRLDSTLFGEGVASLDGLIYQLTWRSRRGFIYRFGGFERVGEFRYGTEGWGLTTDGTHLVMSDGSASLFFLDPRSWQVVRTLEVETADGPVRSLNELEYVDGSILANVWQRDVIVEISPETGVVGAEFDFAGLVAYEGAQGFDSVLNGIAYDAASKRLFVTGKLWSRVYEVELRRPGRASSRAGE